MGAVTLHIVKDMVPVYAVEKLEVHSHVENVPPQVCATKSQQVLTQTRGSRLAGLPGQNCVNRQQAHT